MAKRLRSVGTASIARTLGMSEWQVRNMIYQAVVSRVQDGKHKRYWYHLPEVFQLMVARRMRQMRIGYDTIREVVDRFDIDKEDLVTVSFNNEILITVNRKGLMRKARAALSVANSLEYGTPYRETKATEEFRHGEEVQSL